MKSNQLKATGVVSFVVSMLTTAALLMPLLTLAESSIVVEPEVNACEPTTVTLSGGYLPFTYFITDTEGADASRTLIPSDGSEVEVSVGPFSEDTTISWRVFGGPERDDDIPSWNGYGEVGFSDDINEYEANYDGSYFGWAFEGTDGENPFTTWLELEVPGCDKTAPVVTIDSPADGSGVSGDVTVVGTIEEEEMGNYNVALYEGDADFTDFSQRLIQNNVPNGSSFLEQDIWTFDSTAFPDGEYLIRFAARDAAGNRDLTSPYTGGDDSVHVVNIFIENDLDKNACKKGGWEDYGFRNQGQCVRYVETGKDSR